jgi:HEPN domain-containing protein
VSKVKKNSVKYWIEVSEYDIETAEAMLQTKRYLYVGFMCHQSIEKILKASFVHKTNEHAPRTHNLTLLAQKSGLFDEMNEKQLELLDLLEPLNIQARYPTDKERLMRSLSSEKCQEILTKTREMMVWIKMKLQQ